MHVVFSNARQMKALRSEFLEAAKDYIYFLDRHYPQKALIKLIGDRYQLSGTERSMLFRGIWASEEASLRKQKLAEPHNLISQPISIDTYNMLITIASYLNGNVVFISNDHFLRDASEIHGKVFRNELLERALNLTFEYLNECKLSGIRFLIDSPVSHSGKLCAQINQMIAESNLQGSAETHQSPDYLLKNTLEGIIATSDSTIIDKTCLPVFDLPRHVLQHHFSPAFIDLRNI
jgi:hypothetical protein